MSAIPADARRIAIMCPTWLGDTVMATPVYRAVRLARPDAHITVLTRPAFVPLLASLPAIDDVVSIEPRGTGLFRAARALRSCRADAVLLLPNSARSALIARLAGTRRRIGRRRDGRGLLLTDQWTAPRQSEPRSTVDDYADLAAWALDTDITDRRLELTVPDAARDRAASLVPDRAIVFVPGGVRENKRWPVESFAALADRLAATHEAAIVLSGAPNEQPILAAIAAAARTEVMDLSRERLDLGDVTAVFDRALAVVTNDTGPRHIAAALGRPTVSLFGPTDHRFTTLEGVNERILLSQPFLPQELVADDHPAMCAIDHISVGDVAHAVAGLLDAAPDDRDTPPAAPPG